MEASQDGGLRNVETVCLPVNVDVHASDLSIFDILQTNGDVLKCDMELVQHCTRTFMIKSLPKGRFEIHGSVL